MAHFVLPTALAAWRVISSFAKQLFIIYFLTLGFSTASHSNPVSTDWLGGVPDDGILAYEITRKGKRLGFQTLAFETLENGDLQVDAHIEIDFAIIIPLFRYLHDNREIWRDGRLLSLNSRTDNNGDPEEVKLRLEGDKFVGSGTKFNDDLTADLLTTSYFNPNFIRQKSIISSQDGRRLEIGVEEVGREVLFLETGRVEATRFSLSGKLRIDIWYTDSGQWVKTEFSRGGNTLIIKQVNPASIPARNKWRHP
jgi:hypothetical protein